MFWVVFASCVVAVDQTVTITDPVDRIVVDVTGGDLLVEAAPGPVRITADFGGPGGGPIDDSLHQTELNVVYQCDLCGGRLTITAPAETAIDLTVGAGDLTVEGMVAEITADLSAGSARIHGAGAGPVDVTLDYGDLDASFSRPPDALVGTLKTGTVDVTVPSSVLYALDLDTKNGEVDVGGITEDPSAANTITLHVGTGAIHLTGR